MRRIVVTGIGLVTPLGNRTKLTWDALLDGKSGIGPITHFDSSKVLTQFAGEVRDFDPAPYISAREQRQFDLFLQYGVAAGMEAMLDAGFDDGKFTEEQAERAGGYLGAGLGGLVTIENNHTTAVEKGARHGITPHFICGTIINMLPGLLSIRTGFRGPNISHVSACSSSSHSIGEAARCLMYGDADVMLAGGAEATISLLGVGGFNSMRALSTNNDNPQGASRPFDKNRDGFVIAEGAGVLVLEELEHAKKRKASIYAELIGYGANSDSFHIVQPAPEGAGARRCMQHAIKDAKINLSDIGYVNAHGTSTAFNDRNETQAIRAVFGDHANNLAVSSTKSMTGHMLGAAGGVEAAITTLALHHGVLPPTINYETPDPDCDLDYIPNQARETQVDVALSNSYGFGGANAVLVLHRYQGD